MSSPAPKGPSVVPIILLLLLILFGAAGIYVYATIKPLVAMTGQVVPRGTGATTTASRTTVVPGTAAHTTADAPQTTNTDVATSTTSSSFSLPSLTRQQRVNFLLLGSDTDLKFAPNQYLTQSMILVTVDPKTHTVGMLSIPRDLWIDIPGYGFGKIQIAYEIGGIALARRTVEANFGIHVDYYAWVGLQGFTKMIDTVGGINIDVPHPVLDDAYPDDLNPSDPYAYKRLYIPAGPQHLSGPAALEFVRSRHGDLVGDFGRSARQQMLLLALKQRLTGTTLLFHLPQLANDLQSSVRTDVPLTDLLAYANFARTLTRSEIHQVVLLPPTYSYNTTTPDGSQDIVVPRWPAIDDKVQQMFGQTPEPAPGIRQATLPVRDTTTVATTERRPAVAAESRPTPTPEATARVTPTTAPVVSAPISVLVENGTTVNGLGTRVTRYLERNGFRLEAPINAPHAGVLHTTVTYSSPAARDTAYNIAHQLGGYVIDNSRTGNASTVIIVVVGEDDAHRF
ncbi:MAG: LCP family protein [Chloroflexi bacterium]|nr:LCP family protein [Chloroflexota bacterium]